MCADLEQRFVWHALFNIVVLSLNPRSLSCKKASEAIQILALSQYLAWGGDWYMLVERTRRSKYRLSAFSALRSYALKRNKVISLFVFGLHVVFFAIRVGTVRRRSNVANMTSSDRQYIAYLQVLLSDAQAVINPGTTCLITRSNAPEKPLVL